MLAMILSEVFMEYLTGFANHLSSEALKGALPQDQNSPQKSPMGLYPEQISGTAFTAPRASNLASWVYKIFPSVKHKPFEPLNAFSENCFAKAQISNPNQMRWSPLNFPTRPTTFFQG